MTKENALSIQKVVEGPNKRIVTLSITMKRATGIAAIYAWVFFIMTSVLRTREDPTTDDEPAPPPEAAASEACEPRRRRLRMPDYEQTFLCVSDVQRRAGIYASEETKRKLLDVVQLLGRGNLSLTAYVDNILRHHLEFYREEINRLHKQRNSQNIL